MSARLAALTDGQRADLLFVYGAQLAHMHEFVTLGRSRDSAAGSAETRHVTAEQLIELYPLWLAAHERG